MRRRLWMFGGLGMRRRFWMFRRSRMRRRSSMSRLAGRSHAARLSELAVEVRHRRRREVAHLGHGTAALRMRRERLAGSERVRLAGLEHHRDRFGGIGNFVYVDLKVAAVHADVALGAAHRDRSGRGVEPVIRAGALRMVNGEPDRSVVQHELCRRALRLIEEGELDLCALADRDHGRIGQRERARRRVTRNGVIVVAERNHGMKRERVWSAPGQPIRDAALNVRENFVVASAC